MKLSKEFWVGALVLSVVALLIGFGSLLGIVSPFSRDPRFWVLYDFAGGVETGSAVRVAGVKVGRVERIEFLPQAPAQTGSGDPPELGERRPSIKLEVSVGKRALPAVREDSRFYINMAGIIGERYVEISPGVGVPLAVGSTVRGVDPPRIDQLLSQGYAVFGRIADFLDEKNPTISQFLDQLSLFMKDANEFLKGRENRRLFFALLGNLTSISADLRGVLKEDSGKRFFERLSRLVERADAVDEETLKKFLQEEGIRARIF